MWSCVSVPVLSEQMTSVQPSVSTAGSLRTSAWRLTMRWTPMARPMVTTAASASGTAATARLTPQTNISAQPWPRATPMHTSGMISAMAPKAMYLAMRSRPSWSGVRRFSTPASRPAILPNSVAMPVATTAAFPRPYTTLVPAYAMLRRSPICAAFSTAPVVFSAATDSPVSDASSTRRLIALRSRASAGTRSPVLSWITSPGTSSRAGSVMTRPSRSTAAFGAAISLSLSSARSARYS